MKRLWVLSLLGLAGCQAAPSSSPPASATSYETKLGLTPIPTAAELAKVKAKSPDKQQVAWEARLLQTRDVQVVEKALQEVKLWRSRSKMVEEALSKEKDPARRQRNQKQFAENGKALASLEQAVLIKRSQIESKDFNDSSGEVSKHLTQARQFQANASKIATDRIETGCCGAK